MRFRGFNEGLKLAIKEFEGLQEIKNCLNLQPQIRERSGINRGVAQLASVLAWGARGRKFESSHPDLEGQGFQNF